MNKKVKVLIIALLLPLSVIVPMLLAQTIRLDSHLYAQQSNLQQRVEAYKNKLNTPPPQAELNRLKLRCSVSQTVLKGLQTRVSTVQENRTKAYSKVTERLTKLSTALKEKQVDSAKLDGQIKELEAKIKTFETDIASYKQAVEDSANVECSTDPLALKAGLQEARSQHSKLISEVADIRAYVNNVIKPTLVQIKQDLNAQTSQAQTTTEGANDATQ